MVYSVSLEGFRIAVRDLESAARKIALPNRSAQAVPDGRAGIAVGGSSLLASTSPPSEAGSPDYTVELFRVRQAKTSARANLRVFSLQAELEQEALDLLA